MQARTFWKAVTVDRSDLLEQLLTLFREEQIHFCVIGGLAVNAYVEPVVTLDVDVVVAAHDLTRLEPHLTQHFSVERFPHSLNVSLPGSDLRIQIQLDQRYAPFVARAEARQVLGVSVPVAAPQDVLAGKVWAVEDDTRRPSKRQKDLADIARLLEAFPVLRSNVPAAVLQKLF
jgi:hypothetical protein